MKQLKRSENMSAFRVIVLKGDYVTVNVSVFQYVIFAHLLQ
jgi:hypothetical protein